MFREVATYVQCTIHILLDKESATALTLLTFLSSAPLSTMPWIQWCSWVATLSWCDKCILPSLLYLLGMCWCWPPLPLTLACNCTHTHDTITLDEGFALKTGGGQPSQPHGLVVVSSSSPTGHWLWAWTYTQTARAQSLWCILSQREWISGAPPDSQLPVTPLLLQKVYHLCTPI